MEDLTGSNFLPCELLTELGPGLNVEEIHDALRYGEASANSCTANDPAILSGFLRWARTLRGLRDRLAAHGWRRGTLLGMPTVVSPDGKVGIAVSTGDEGTGTEADARTKYRKGAAAVSAIETNQLIFGGDGFDSTSDEERNEAVAPADRATWYLLFVKVGDEIRAELSLPSDMGTDGRIEGLTSRYLMPPLNLTEPPPRPARDEPDDIVDVARR